MARQGVYSRRVSFPQRLVRGVKRRWREFSRLSKKKKALIIGGPILAFLILVPLITYIYYYNDIADQERLMNRNNTGVVLLDNAGKPFYTVGRAEHRDVVPLKNISKEMKDALLASEDDEFYEHSGFSITGIIRAVTSAGSRGGGSTITQQLAKNTLLTDQRSFLRKYQELALSMAIEHRYSKDQILEMYLNSIFFGGTNFGIKDAAKFYFNTTPDKLNLAQSAMLVGILPAPNAYSPTLGNPTYAKQRQTTVLNRMVATERITNAQRDAALAEKLDYAAPTKSQSSDAPHFAEMVLSELYKKYGQEHVLRSGYQVKTTLDLGLQRQLKQSITGHLPYIQGNGGSNASGIAIDPKSGEVRALVGSADYSNKKWGKVNMATTARQPGSSFKTIYYAQALEQGVITPATVLEDEPTDFGGYTPRNADGSFSGDVTVRQAIGRSLNIPSVKVLQKLGIEDAITAAQRFGITTIKKDNNYGLSLALGSAEAQLDQMTNAYAALANNGNQYPTNMIKEVKNKFDKTIFTQSETSHSVISPEAAFLTSSILSDYNARAPTFGGSLSVPGHTAAVKTGTTDDSRDAWTIGYTPSIALGVWVGNNDNTQMYNGGSGMAGPIWVNTMSQYLADKPDERFNPPDGIVQRAVCRGNGALASKSGINTYNEYFMSLHLPSENCEAKQKPVMIEVCRLSDKKMISIDEKKFDSELYSKNADDCKKKEEEKPKTIEVCNLETKEIETINEDEYDEALYSKDLSECEDTPPVEPPTPPVPNPFEP